MSRILVVGEDALCCALGERLVAACLPDWQSVQPSIDTKGVTKLQPSLPRYVGLARSLHPVLCIVPATTCISGLLFAADGMPNVQRNIRPVWLGL